MPRNASGIYTLPGGNPVTPGDVIEAEWANTTLEDVADALTNSLSRTGAGGMLAPFRIADGNISGPGLSYLNETNTGLYRSGSGSVWMSVLGVNTAQFSTVGLTIPSGKALTAVGNASVGGTFAVGGAATFSSTLALTGALTATGGVVGNVTGNVTAGSGTSTFNDVVITGALDMTAGSSATITGLSDPTNASDAANKSYVDAQVATRLALTGGTMSGAIAMGSSKITGLATPTADQDAATKAYVDSVAQGLDVKASCRAATTANITLSGAQTIDGVAIIAGDRVLVKDQSSAAQNGIYVAAAGAWSRSTDADTWAELVGAFTFVEDGTVNDNTGWVCTSAPGGTLGVTAVTFEQFSGAGQVIAGTGMSKTGNTLNVNTASSSRIVVGSDEIDLATTGVTASTYKSVTVDQWGRVTAGSNPTTLAGFGITDAYTQAQVDAALALKLNLTGGTMSGAIAMGTNKITGLGDPTLAQDAATKNYIDTIFGSTTTAAASAAAAAASASAASSSASSASGSATAAASSAASAAASYDSFDDRYLGAKASDPTTDNDGNPLLTGALYWNTTSNAMKVYDGSAWVAAYLPTAGFAQLGAANVFTANQTITDNSSNAALKITQTGSGNALYIEDVAADATPFVVSSTGAVGIGTTTPDNVTSAGIALVSNDGYYPQVVNRNKTNDANASYMVFDKDRAGAIVQSGDNLGNIVWRSFDGANYLQSAAIIGYSDGAPGTNDVPGALSFLTTADGAAAPTERVRIASTGAVAFNGSYGTSGQVLTSGGSGAAPTWGTPTAGGENTFVATGSITQGNPVSLRSDGTVEVTTGSVGAYSAGTGTSYFTATGTSNGSVIFDVGANRYVFVYSNDAVGGYPAAKVGILTGTTFSYGAEVILESTYSYQGVQAVYDPVNAKTVIFSSPANGVRAFVCTISGSTITVGGSTDFANTNTLQTFCASYHPPSGKVCVAYSQGQGRLKMGTVSGTSISTGSQYVFDASTCYNMTMGYHAASGNMALFYTTWNGATYASGIAYSLSGTVPTFGSSVGSSILMDTAAFFKCCYSTTTQRLILATTYSASNFTWAIVNVSGTTVSFGNSGTIAGVATGSGDICYDTTYGRVNVTYYNDNVGGYAKFQSGTDTTTGITWATAIDVGSANGSNGGKFNGGIAYNPTGLNTAVSSRLSGNAGNQGTLVSAPLTTNYTTWIGMSTQTVTNGQNVAVTTLAGANNYQSGLAINSVYYLSPLGALTTSASPVKVGKALSATKLLVTEANA